MFHLRAAERRARRPHLTVQDHYHNFETIANSIAAKCDVNHSAGSPTCSVISTIHVQLPIVCKSTGDTVSATPHMAASSSRARTHRRAAKSAAQNRRRPPLPHNRARRFVTDFDLHLVRPVVPSRCLRTACATPAATPAERCSRTREAIDWSPAPTPRCCGPQGHRPTDSFGACSPSSSRVASLRLRFAVLSALADRSAPACPDCAFMTHISGDSRPEHPNGLVLYAHRRSPSRTVSSASYRKPFIARPPNVWPPHRPRSPAARHHQQDL